ncbi:MerR family DNA-binding transcriptional regulator [Salmonella enterica subsp. enterica]|nr:MerR family DNA-binding transcriptional regulator [Salmonella enterica subsp. enterica]
MSISVDSNDAALAATTGSGPLPTDDNFVRIGEIARTYGVTLRTLRFYEDKKLLSPKREGNARLYSPIDIKRLQLILLGRKVGFSLREVKQMLDLYDPAGTNIKQLRFTAEKGERQLGRLIKQRALLDESIQELQGALDTTRQKLAERVRRNQN